MIYSKSKKKRRISHFNEFIKLARLEKAVVTEISHKIDRELKHPKNYTISYDYKNSKDKDTKGSIKTYTRIDYLPRIGDNINIYINRNNYNETIWDGALNYYNSNNLMGKHEKGKNN